MSHTQQQYYETAAAHTAYRLALAQTIVLGSYRTTRRGRLWRAARTRARQKQPTSAAADSDGYFNYSAVAENPIKYDDRLRLTRIFT